MCAIHYSEALHRSNVLVYILCFLSFLSYFTYLSKGDYLIGKSKRNLCYAELITLPLFLRFDEIDISGWNPDSTWLLMERERGRDVSVNTMCERIQDSLRLFVPVLRNSNMVYIHNVYVDHNRETVFSEYAQLLHFISNILLFLCHSSHSYKFNIIDLNELTGINIQSTNLLASLIELAPINQCLYFHIGLYSEGKNQIPVRAISRWLNCCFNGIELIGKSSKERLLKIQLNNVQNAYEMCENLKEVHNIELIYTNMISIIIRFSLTRLLPFYHILLYWNSQTVMENMSTNAKLKTKNQRKYLHCEINCMNRCIGKKYEYRDVQWNWDKVFLSYTIPCKYHSELIHFVSYYFHVFMCY